MSSRTPRGKTPGEDNSPDSSANPPAPQYASIDRLTELMATLIATVNNDIARRQISEEARLAEREEDRRREEARLAEQAAERVAGEARPQSLLMAITGQSRETTPSPPHLQTPQTHVQSDRRREEAPANEPSQSSTSNATEQQISPQAPHQAQPQQSF